MIRIATHVDIVLVTYNSRRFLPDFFASLKNSTSIPYHLLAIDNASTDQTQSYLSRIKFKEPGFRWMRVIPNTENIGVAKAWNMGIRLGSAPYIILVNPDIKFTTGWLERMVDCAEKHPRAGVVGGKIVDFNRIIDHAGFVGGIVRGRGEPGDSVQYNQIVEVDGIHGCCFLVKRQIWETIGAFDERFFIYAEEDDFCRRVKQAGFSVLYCPAEIHHYGAGSDIPFDKRQMLHRQSLQKFYQKWGL